MLLLANMRFVLFNKLPWQRNTNQANRNSNRNEAQYNRGKHNRSVGNYEFWYQ